MAGSEYGRVIEEVESVCDDNYMNYSGESNAFKMSIPKKEFEPEQIKSEDVTQFVNYEMKSEKCSEEVKEDSYCEVCGGLLLYATDFFSPDNLKFTCICQCQYESDIQSENTDVKPFGFGSDLGMSVFETQEEKIAGKKKNSINGNVSSMFCDKEFTVEGVHLVEHEIPCEKEEIEEIFRTDVESFEKNHTEKKRLHQCQFCSKSFNHRCRLKKHEKIHTGQKPFQCNICSKSFSESGNLKIHEKIHTGEKPYQCKICSKSFLRNNDLKSHENIHTGEKPFQCKICSKSFNDCSNLRRHTKIHSFKCNVCSKSFIESTDLKTHEMIHADGKLFQCKICSRSFVRSSYLKLHEKMHTVGKTFQCGICSISFRNFCNLKSHEKIHTGEKLLQCKICSKSFSQCMCGKLKRHEKIHAGKKLSMKSVLDHSVEVMS